ncbi:hypothetical protein OG871_22920 [Kitasatospora sp. NBC_00374]|uniref:hypothetical protein n=1 Tax=Kitasatospora sp. NBC_00374 TaxID=2975964 RepID=UPI0032463800
MADNENATAEAVVPTPVVAAAPSEYTPSEIDPQPILEVLEGLTDEPEVEPLAEPKKDKPGSGEVYEPLGNVTNHP